MLSVCIEAIYKFPIHRVHNTCDKFIANFVYRQYYYSYSTLYRKRGKIRRAKLLHILQFSTVPWKYTNLV